LIEIQSVALGVVIDGVVGGGGGYFT